ncbi:MAG: SIMPL domain-containing protein [Caldilineaceae bacterium]|nr:SIMPL domain-containing protein [Caldilineaceae bacterium]
MKHITLRTVLSTTLAAAILLGGTVAAVSTRSWVPAAYAQEAGDSNRTITVVGEGVVKIQPDVARANIGVEVMRPSVEEAAAENNTRTETLLNTLKELGIAEEDLQTSGYNVYAERYGPSGPVAENEVQYRVTNSVSVTIRNLEEVGQVLDAAIKAGANNIYGVEFLLEDASSARSEARQKAVDNARATAEELASLNGVQVGKIVGISEIIASQGGFYNNSFASYEAGLGGGGGAPIQPGQLRLTMQIQITYELLE